MMVKNKGRKEVLRHFTKKKKKKLILCPSTNQKDLGTITHKIAKKRKNLKKHL